MGLRSGADRDGLGVRAVVGRVTRRTAGRYRQLLGATVAGLLLLHVVFVFARIHAGPGVYMTIGAGVLDGRLPYVDYYDHKPPGIYVTLAAVFAVFDSVLAVKLLVLAVNLSTALVAHRLVRRYVNPPYGLVAVGLFLAGALVYNGHHAYTTPFVALFGLLATAALLAADRTGQSQYLLLVGLATGVATTYKQTALAFLGAFVVYVVVRSRQSRRRVLLDLALLLVGVAAPIALVAGWFAIRGQFDSFVYWTLLVHIAGTPYGGPALETVAENGREITTFPLLWASALAGAALSLRHRADRGIRIVALVALFSTTPMIIHGWGYYYLQLLPFAAILGAYAIRETRAALDPVGGRTEVRVGVVAVLLVLSVPFGQALGWMAVDPVGRHDLGDDQEVGSLVQQRTTEGEPILVLGEEAEFYYLSDREPMNRQLYYLSINRHLYDEQALIAAIERREIRMVVMEYPCQSTITRVCQYVMERFELLERRNHIRIYSRSNTEQRREVPGGRVTSAPERRPSP